MFFIILIILFIACYRESRLLLVNLELLLMGHQMTLLLGLKHGPSTKYSVNGPLVQSFSSVSVQPKCFPIIFFLFGDKKKSKQTMSILRRNIEKEMLKFVKRSWRWNQQRDNRQGIMCSFRPKISDAFYFQISYLTIHFIHFFINIIYFVMTYFIIRDTLIMIYLFYN